MKTRHIILSLGLVCFFATTGFADNGDTTTKLLDVAVASNPLLKGMEYIPTFTVYNGTLYMINKGKLVQADLKTGAITLNKPVTDFLKRFPSEPSAVSQLRVTANEYYLIVWNELYRIAASGEATKIYENYGALQGLSVVNDKLVIAKIDTMALISKNGKLLNLWVFPDGAVAGFYKGEKGVYYTANGEDSLLEFQSGNGTDLSVNKYPPLVELRSLKEAWLSYASDKYFIVFDYTKRNEIYVIKKDPAKHTLYKTIGVKGANLTPTHQQVMDEEGTPNLEIGYSDNVYYILSIIKGKLKVLAFTV